MEDTNLKRGEGGGEKKAGAGMEGEPWSKKRLPRDQERPRGGEGFPGILLLGDWKVTLAFCS